MNMAHRNAFIDGDYLVLRGMDYGSPNAHQSGGAQLQILAYNRQEGLLAVHVKGHTYWSSIGSPHAYAPASIEVFRILYVDGDNLTVEDVLDVPKSKSSWGQTEGIGERVKEGIKGTSA